MCYHNLMNNEELAREVREQRKVIDQIYISVEKTRKYFLWTMIATIITFVLPLIAIAFMIPMLLNSVAGLTSSLSTGL